MFDRLIRLKIFGWFSGEGEDDEPSFSVLNQLQVNPAVTQVGSCFN